MRCFPRALIIAAVVSMSAALPAAAAEVSLLFADGYVGTQGTSVNKADNIQPLTNIGIRTIGFFQTDTGSGTFTLQGNDVPGTVRFFLADNTVVSRSGSLVWRETQGSNVQVFGFLLNAGQPDVVLNAGSPACKATTGPP